MKTDIESRQVLPHALIIRSTTEFKRILRTGRRYSLREFVLYVVRRGDRGQRIGIRVGKRVGTAVQRNRIKRLVREVYRRNRSILDETAVMVVIARSTAKDLSYDECAARLIELWRKSKVIRD